ncbi:MAG: DNA-binding protein [Pseudomonadota bacterium]
MNGLSMGRTGITYEQVADVADALSGEGLVPTIRAVRERIGTGSPNTVQRHLLDWRAARVPAPALPALATSSTAGPAAALPATSELPTSLVGAIAVEIARQGQELARARHAVEQAHVELAQQRNRADGLNEKIMVQAQEIVQLRSACETERSGRIGAEQQAAVLAARLEAVQAQALQAERREQAGNAQLQAVGAELAAARKETGEARREARQSGEEAAELRGRLAVS